MKENALDKNSPVRVEKPWGYELHWAKTDRYVGKHIHINKGHALSLQYHNKKDETIFLYAGARRRGQARRSLRPHRHVESVDASNRRYLTSQGIALRRPAHP
jgi:hypothetical protein